MSTTKIGISMGDDTEDFLTEILSELDDQTLSQLTVERELEHSVGLAGEPITIGVAIGGATVVVSAVLRIVERCLEYHQQRDIMRLVAEGFDKDPKLGAALAGISKKYADVSIKYGLARESWAVPEANKGHGH